MNTEVNPTCSSGGESFGSFYEPFDGSVRTVRETIPYCRKPATFKHFPVGARPGHFNYLCVEHAEPIISGRLEAIKKDTGVEQD